MFDPRRGFFIEVDDKREAQGAYECTAEQDGSERTLEFHAKVLPAPEIGEHLLSQFSRSLNIFSEYSFVFSPGSSKELK